MAGFAFDPRTPVREVPNMGCGAGCGHSGPRDEFIGYSRDDSGREFLVALDDAPEGSLAVCVGCASRMGRADVDLVAGFVRAYLHGEGSL